MALLKGRTEFLLGQLNVVVKALAFPKVFIYFQRIFQPNIEPETEQIP